MSTPRAEPGGASTGRTPDAPSGVLTAPDNRALQWVSQPGGVQRLGFDVDLIEGAPPPRRWRASVATPLVALIALVIGYVGSILLWPLDGMIPAPTTLAAPIDAAPAATITWPSDGSAAVSVAGFGDNLSSNEESASIASITKLVTALMVLDAMPLTDGQGGPSLDFTAEDDSAYWGYLNRGESALAVPVDGSLTERQLLEGMLVGSANNYAERLATWLWPTREEFAAAAQQWLANNKLEGITVVEPTGIDAGNTGTAAAVIALSEKAMADPVVSAIVGMRTVTLPGAGLVENTNELIGEPGIVGIKTGTLDRFNVAVAQDLTVDGVNVQLYVAVLGQPDEESRFVVAKDLLDQVSAQLRPSSPLAEGTVVGRSRTPWGETIEAATTAPASVLLWNSASAASSVRVSLDGHTQAGDIVGTVTLTGPVNATSVEVALTSDIEGPSPWWRLSHPLDVFGLNG